MVQWFISTFSPDRSGGTFLLWGILLKGIASPPQQDIVTPDYSTEGAIIWEYPTLFTKDRP